MNQEHKQPDDLQPHQNTPPRDDEAPDPQTPPDFALDVDSALAAIADLTTLAGDDGDEPPQSETDETEPVDEETITADESAEQPEVTQTPPALIRPPMSTLKRGQMASVLPAFALIATGIALTYALFNDITLQTTSLIALAPIALGVLALAHWLSSRRWAQGSLLIGSLLITTTLAFSLWQQPDNLPMWYLMPAGWAFAFFLTGILGHAHNSRLLFIGAVFTIIALAGWLIMGDALSPELRTTFANLTPVVLVIAVLWLIVPTRRA